MKTKKSISLQNRLTQELTELVEQLQSCQDGYQKYDLFQTRLKNILIMNNVYEVDSLQSIIYWAKVNSSQQKNSPYWDYTIKVLHTLTAEKQYGLPGNNYSSQDSNHSGSIVAQDEKHNWLEINEELADMDRLVERIKRIKFIRPIVEFVENIDSYKILLYKLVRKVQRITRTLLLFGLLDKLFIWLRENHKERRFIVELATILLFVGKVLWGLIVIFGYVFNPARLIRKLLPRELDDALPADYY